ncbi:MAG: glycerol-3-phosphate 1-O-acyltransferase PlsY [Anaerolineae bacterium]
MWWSILSAMVAGYLFGAVPVGYLVGRIYGIDIRQHGSGRTGGTNVWRALGLGPAILTVLGDALKAAVAVLVARHLLGAGEYGAALAGGMAVVGHNWSVFLGLRGGAGGVTAGIGLMALNPLVGIVVVPLAIFTLYISHFASVGTLTVGIGGLLLLGILVWISPWIVPPAHLIYGTIAAVAIVIALIPNIRRLIQGTERRITLW